MNHRKFKHRDINWLYFNERVLLEAANKDTPLLERLKFLAIFSSNLDEFFKVRISQLRQLKKVDKQLRKKLVLKANKKLKFILKTVNEQQEVFGRVVDDTLNELRKHQIYIRDIAELDEGQKAFLTAYFNANIKPFCKLLDTDTTFEPADGQLYLLVDFGQGKFNALTIPSKECERFIALPGEGSNFIFLDDVLRLNLNDFFRGEEVIGSYSIKISRDAELYLEDDYDDTQLVEKIYQSLGQRKSGQPTRLLYDADLPENLRNILKNSLGLGTVDMISGGRYHNMSDFFGFPIPVHTEALQYRPLPPLEHPKLSLSEAIFDDISKKDQLVHFPYQSFSVVERFIHAAAIDQGVTTIKMSLYRIAKSSKLTDSILLALKNGKKVLLFVEAQARFDEKNNITWGRTFEEKGAKVLFSVPNIKVHSKVALVEREEEGRLKRYAYIATGNFNSKTAKLYCDHGLFTAHDRITQDLSQVFDVLERKLIIPKLKHLLVSPFTTRNKFMELVQNEMNFVKTGKAGKITLKMNSLEDTKMINALYEASEAGVEVRLIVRGFCCLVPKKEEDMLPNEKPIVITSIIDRYLEHGRIYLFENGGDELMYMGSADWMTRNLDRRIEVLTPILDSDIFDELRAILQIQLSDNVKARFLDAKSSNERVLPLPKEPEIRSQYAIYDYLKRKVR